MTQVFAPGLFAGKTVFVTGGSSGINLAIATAFGELGAKVAINGRKVEKLDAAVASLRAKGITCEGFAADVRDYAAIDGALESATKKLGAIDFATTIAPGVRDVLLTGKVKEAVTRTADGRRVYDAVVLDAPPTGR